jgi:hypothetical protein
VSDLFLFNFKKKKRKKKEGRKKEGKKSKFP